MSPNVFTIPASAPFAETLARGLIVRTGAADDPLALTKVTIYLPTRRAARVLNDTFARLLDGAALLPEVRPLGDVDEDELLFDTASEPLTMPPAISPIRRHLLLAAMVRRWDRAKRGGDPSFAQALALARALAKLLDEAETLEIDFSRLNNLAPATFAAHWSELRDFLSLLRTEWPKLLQAEKALDSAARRNIALRALAKRLRERPTQDLIVAAGSTGSIPATAELLGAIAHLPNGFVVLPGLDRGLDASSWNDLDPGHPQFGLKQLLGRIGVAREGVKDFDSPAKLEEREALLREALRPAPTTDAWRALAETGGEEIAKGLDGLSLVEAAHPGEEAATIALLFRHALEPASDQPMTAALVTPDRDLARRVAAEMGRWGIQIDDSGGRPLSHTPPGIFLCLLAEAAAADFAPVALLALLKHPLAAGGQGAADFRRRVRQLDGFCLRGPRPDPGLNGIRAAIAAALKDARGRSRRFELERISELAYWFEPVAEILRQFAESVSQRTSKLSEIVDAHLVAAEELATSDAENGAVRLWRGDAGEAMAVFAAELRDSASGLPEIEPSSYPLLFRALLDERQIRPAYGTHPQLAILGPLEARLQSFDLVILGGLNEGRWPASAEADPWLSRPMRMRLGLESPERHIGLAAHDFAMLAASPKVILTRAQKADGAPTLPSRWLQRLQQMTRGLRIETKLAPDIDYAALAAIRDVPQTPPTRMPRPKPCPPVSARPRRLSVTEIETWLRDPYAIYAKHVLRLEPLDPLDAEIGPLERGSAIHAALEQFLNENGEEFLADAHLRLIAISDEIFRAANLPKAALALWRPRFVRAAQWFVTEERRRRAGIRSSHLEIRGERSFEGQAGEFVLRARADRIDLLVNGGAAVIDYKTGSLPTTKQVKTLLAPQLPLEGAILASGGFSDAGKVTPSELIYIRFGGGAEPGEIRELPEVANLIRQAEQNLTERIRDFDNVAMPYLPRIAPLRAEIAGGYDHLSRVREWSLIGWEESDE